MEKEEILAISRKENGNRDLAEMETAAQAGSIAARVGAGVCCLVSALFAWVTKTAFLSPWIIYFSILGTQSLVKFIKTKRKSDLALAVLYFVLFILCLTFFVLRLIEVKE